MKSETPLVAIVGRTNVGKSTLFNRLIERNKAMVSDVPGTTRDRNEGDCLWRGQVVRLIDTGGMDIDKHNEIEVDILKQSKKAMDQADLLLFVVDMKSGAMPQERELAELIRSVNKPVIVVGNKAETLSERLSVTEAEWNFQDLPEPFPVSAVRGTGTGDLLDQVFDRLTEMGKPPTEQHLIEGIKVAVIGKPNVGKSTLLNSIVGEERFITSPVSHTTREPNDILVQTKDQNYIFIDTAGMRKKHKVRKAGGLEAVAVARSERIVRAADVTILVVDATKPIGNQEKVLAGTLKGSGSAVLIVANKWDLVPDKNVGTMKQYRKYFAATLPFLRWAPIIFTSALTGQRVKNLFGEVDKVYATRQIKFSNKELSEFLAMAISRKRPTKGKGPKPPKLLGLQQVSIAPPLFDLVIKSKRSDFLSVSYVRYLENRLREQYNLEGTPLRIRIRLLRSGSK
ncbi:MAG: ribosome biogenesis GTPase Der [bacterium]|jgi:GTPase|nr:ribosome biogenesis GTPase Der [bacterium]